MPRQDVGDRMPQIVRDTVQKTPILDIHTHIYTPRFGKLLLWGLDELLTYHYLVAEVFSAAPLPYATFWAMSKSEQADYIWKHLFVERSPVSEACRGVLTVLKGLGLDASEPDLTAYRKFFASMTVEEYVDKVFATANVKGVIMTNDPFDEAERPVWEKSGRETDPRFQAALRIDPLIIDFAQAASPMRKMGYDVKGDLGAADIDAVKRFLRDWIERMNPRYMAVSLTPDFRYPEDSPSGKMIEQCIIPIAEEAGIPFATMIGVRRQVNPGLRVGGDGVGVADVDAVNQLCLRHPNNRFLCTMLSRDNQHELCVSSRKHPNLHIFGCWWFLNNPSIIEEMTRQRFELLGLSFTPQHSDARVLDQLIYKWAHSRAIIADVLIDKYRDIQQAGWVVTEDEIQRDVEMLVGGTFETFCAGARST